MKNWLKLIRYLIRRVTIQVSIILFVSLHILCYCNVVVDTLACEWNGQLIPVGDYYHDITKENTGTVCRAQLCKSLTVSGSHGYCNSQYPYCSIFHWQYHFHVDSQPTFNMASSC